jgi:uncharacterized protein (DUF1800 family)
MKRIFALAAVVTCAAIVSADQSSGDFAKKLSGDQAILHALNRLTFGPRPGDIEAVQKMGLSKWIDLQLHPERVPRDQALETLTRNLVEPSSPEEAGMKQLASGIVEREVGLRELLTPEQIRLLRAGSDKDGLDFLATLPREKVVQVLAMMPAVRKRLMPQLDGDLRMMVEAAAPPDPRKPGQTLAQAKFYRAIKSDRQLEEVLADFWFNHFNVDASKGVLARYMITDYERDAIRPHVLGKFRDLLEATATSPAMMFYLDNWRSTIPKPANANRPKQAERGLNENYARELMELHTLGVDGGYTQKDVTEVARCFTGWTIYNQVHGAFYFNPRMHDQGKKVVLGVTIPAGGGREDGERVLDILSRHPSTARFISRELAQRFVADDPPQALIDRMAKTFHDTDGDIRAVLTTLFESPEFFSEGAYRAKLKTPFETMVSAVRATGAKVDSAKALVIQISALGEPLYRKLEPTGYSNVGADWMNSAGLMARMNFAMDLTANHVEGVQVDTARFSAVARDTARGILFADASPATLDAIGGQDDPAVVAGMLLGSPDFQRR